MHTCWCVYCPKESRIEQCSRKDNSQIGKFSGAYVSIFLTPIHVPWKFIFGQIHCSYLNSCISIFIQTSYLTVKNKMFYPLTMTNRSWSWEQSTYYSASLFLLHWKESISMVYSHLIFKILQTVYFISDP